MQTSTNDIILLVLAITVVFLVLAAFLAVYIYTSNQKKKKHMEEKALMKEAFERESIKIQMEVQEQTIQTIAREIHDNIGQLLSIAKLTLSTVSVPEESVKARDKIDNTKTLIDTSIKELRHLASVLNAQNLLSEGLVSAVEKELEWLARTERYHIELTRINSDRRLEIDPKNELIAFRIIQEIINNIIKHAQAAKIFACFKHTENSLIITIADDGIGFDVEATKKKPQGLGINNLYRRAEMIKGTISIDSVLSKGTTFTLEIPFK